MSARLRLPQGLACLTRTELERVVRESALSKTDEVIATRYAIDKYPLIDTAAELGWRRQAVARRWQTIEPRLLYVAGILYPERTCS